MNKYLLIFAAALSVTACGGNQPQGMGSGNLFSDFFSETPAGVATFAITNQEGQAIPGAQVLIGEALNVPFEGNFLEADQNGMVALPVEFQGQPVTIAAPGYVRVTFFDQQSEDHRYILRAEDRPATLELSGITTGFGSLPKDGIADFGLVIPALTRADIFAFDIGLVLSPVMDQFEVAGQQMEVPSNITLPRQRESYFIPITLEKEPYRVFFGTTGIKKVQAIRGQFPFKQVVGKLRNGESFANMINDFTFVSASVRDFNVTQNMTSDIPVNEQTLANPVAVKVPAFANDKVLIALTVSDANGYLLPGDIKRVEPNQTINLKTAKFGNQFVVTVERLASDFYATTPRNGPLSAVMVPLKPGQTPSSIDLFDIPNVKAYEWSARAPAVRGKLNPLATYAVLSRIDKLKGSEKKVRMWEAYANNWQSGMKLPEFPNDQLPTGPKRWEVSYLGNENITVVNFDPAILNSASHVSYNVKDFN